MNLGHWALFIDNFARLPYLRKKGEFGWSQPPFSLDQNRIFRVVILSPSDWVQSGPWIIIWGSSISLSAPTVKWLWRENFNFRQTRAQKKKNTTFRFPGLRVRYEWPITNCVMRRVSRVLGPIPALLAQWGRTSSGQLKFRPLNSLVERLCIPLNFFSWSGTDWYRTKPNETCLNECSANQIYFWCVFVTQKERGLANSDSLIPEDPQPSTFGRWVSFIYQFDSWAIL